MEKISQFLNHWQFDRSLTLDLLASMSIDDLAFSPGPSVGPLWKQFRHIGRVQENFMDALKAGSAKFAPNGSFDATADGGALMDYFHKLDDELRSLLSEIDPNKRIDWFGEEQLSVFEHLMRMLSHETLHHGQLIVYCKLLGKPFPKSWIIWGL